MPITIFLHNLTEDAWGGSIQTNSHNGVSNLKINRLSRKFPGIRSKRHQQCDHCFYMTPPLCMQKACEDLPRGTTTMFLLVQLIEIILIR